MVKIARLINVGINKNIYDVDELNVPPPPVEKAPINIQGYPINAINNPENPPPNIAKAIMIRQIIKNVIAPIKLPLIHPILLFYY